ncbi:MAG: SAM-dependent methyltransferase [Lactobacillales bacterium]|jgi:SAM-dependent methyltransferase|nr:SAM-dependent methyltransferase [Lactobacillales bacterium]
MQESLSDILKESFAKIVVGNPVQKNDPFKKAVIRKISIKNKACYQAEEFVGTKAVHKNMDEKETATYLTGLLKSHFQEAYVLGDGFEYQCRYKNGRFSVKKMKSDIKRETPETHNKKKKYVLPENMPVAPLIELGIMDAAGHVFKNKMDKFIQINHFLGIANEAAKQCALTEKITILDLCCGKSYLTFILYYFFKEVKGIKCRIIGVDLKDDVIKKCQLIKGKLGYESIDFIHGDIEKYQSGEEIDLVVSLHACDIATDVMLKSAVRNKAKIILAVPCCHKEAAGQIKNKELDFLLKYGLLKERFAALLTDAIRANYLENNGYKTDILEFVDFDNSPKNVMIRGIYTGKKAEHALKEDAGRFGVGLSILKE